MTASLRPDAILLSCEHGGNRIPASYASLFSSRASQRALLSHRGWDPGALEVARHLRSRLGARLIFSEVSRLLVDLNRSEHHASTFSEYSSGLDKDARQVALCKHYLPHRRRVQEQIEDRIASGHRVVHLGIHSFTSRLDGVQRNADIGFLYDPQRAGEKALCAGWRAHLLGLRPQLRIRSNYPYRGTADGFTTALRKRYDASSYLGIEVEISQGLMARPSLDKADLARCLAESLRMATNRPIKK